MNEKSEDKNQDIKPVRPEASSSREKRRSKGVSFLFSSMMLIAECGYPQKFFRIQEKIKYHL